MPFRLWLPLFMALAACSAPRPLSPAEVADGTLSVGFLIVDGVYNSELMAPYDIFHHTVFHADPGMRVFTVAPSLAPVTSFEGLRILPDYTYASAPRIDILVVPSAEHSMDSDLEDETMLRFVRERGAAANTLVSLCDGAFVLAAAGLLDGHVATTFPSDIPDFEQRFPRVTVRRDLSFVHDRKVITSAGGALSYDAAMYLCEILYGEQATRGIGRGMCIDWNLDAIPHETVR